MNCGSRIAEDEKTEKQMPKHCPVVGAGARMTRAAFAVICLAEQKRATISGHITAVFTPFCLRCGIGEEVKRLAGLLAEKRKKSECGLVSAPLFYGRPENRFAAPDGLDFVELEKLQEERSMATAEKVEKKKETAKDEVLSSPAVPVGNWKQMTYAEAEKLGPQDLVGIWLTPTLKSGKKGRCPNCRRQNLTVASYGICSWCRSAVVDKYDGKIDKRGIAMLAALAARAAEAGCGGVLVSGDPVGVLITESAVVEPATEIAAVGHDPALDAADDAFWQPGRKKYAECLAEAQADAVPPLVEGGPNLVPVGGEASETGGSTAWFLNNVTRTVQAENDELQSRLDAAFLVLPGYESLAGILQEAMDQAQSGKGVERHAGVGEPFDEQMICAITRRVGLGFPLGQAIKKAVESKRLGGEAGRREILGAINYLSAAVICGREGVE